MKISHNTILITGGGSGIGHLYNTFLSQADKAVLALNGLELN